jgi:hypothetical protein
MATINATPATKLAYTIPELSALGLGSRATIYRRRKAGIYRFVRISGRDRMLAAELTRILEQGEAGATV